MSAKAKESSALIEEMKLSIDSDLKRRQRGNNDLIAEREKLSLKIEEFSTKIKDFNKQIDTLV